MASYFNAARDSALLPESVRGHDDVPTLAPVVEADVIRFFTDEVPVGGELVYGGKKLDTHRFVFLRGYTVDADEADADVVLAIRRAVAEVLTWRLRTRDRDPSLQSDGGPNSQKSYRPGSDSHFPKGWTRWLASYDTRPKVYTL